MKRLPSPQWTSSPKLAQKTIMGEKVLTRLDYCWSCFKSEQGRAENNCEAEPVHQSQALLSSKFTQQRPLANASTVKGAGSKRTPLPTFDLPSTSLVNSLVIFFDCFSRRYPNSLTHLVWHKLFPNEKIPIFLLGTDFCTWNKAMTEQKRITRLRAAWMMRDERAGAGGCS